jgi:hypothetical protein
MMEVIGHQLHSPISASCYWYLGALGKQTVLILVLMIVMVKTMRRKEIVTTTFSLKDSLNFEGEMVDKYVNVCWLQSLLEVDISDMLKCPLKRIALHLF